MSSRDPWRVCVGVWVVLLASGAALGAQSRFETVARDAVATTPGLHVITIRDNALAVCYSLFVIEAAPPGQNLVPADRLSVQDSAALRDRRLSELSTELEKARSTAVPGTLGPNVLAYEWEGQKAQAEFERVLREKELAEIEAQLKQIADTPRVAVAGPAPCSPRTPSAQQDQKR